MRFFRGPAFFGFYGKSLILSTKLIAQTKTRQSHLSNDMPWRAIFLKYKLVMTHCRQIFRDSKNREKLDIFNQAFYWNARKLVSTIFWDDYGLFKDQFSGKSGANHCTRKKVRANCVRGENCARAKSLTRFSNTAKGSKRDSSGRGR